VAVAEPSRFDPPQIGRSARFDLFFSNPSVLSSDAAQHASVVWLVLRVPGGQSIRRDTADSRVVAALEHILTPRLGRHTRSRGWTTTQTVSVVRYGENGTR
jgi:hypothetical protein